MSKPKIVCVAGSAILAPLSIAVAMIGGGAILAALFTATDVHVKPIGPPHAGLWIAMAIAVLPLITGVYRCFFAKCYRPPPGVDCHGHTENRHIARVVLARGTR
jgi:hypothetical protein